MENKASVWWVILSVLAGLIVGLGVFIFYLSKPYSYLSENPKTCVNCHIMAPQYATWSRSSHKEVANCNDCHVPHNNIFNTYFFKGKDGMRHATIFTLRGESQVIFIEEEGAEVVQNNCIRCHSELFEDHVLSLRTSPGHKIIEGKSCVECHREVPHGRVNSLSSTPNATVPLPESPVPDWLKMNKKK